MQAAIAFVPFSPPSECPFNPLYDLGFTFKMIDKPYNYYDRAHTVSTRERVRREWHKSGLFQISITLLSTCGEPTWDDK